MWLFNKKHSLIESGIFHNWEDRHSHILPGVDDGIRNIKDSLEVLKFYEQLGIKTVWLTPHIMEECPNEPTELKERFEVLKENYAAAFKERQTTNKDITQINLRLAAENMIDSLFVKRLEQGNLLPYGENADELLVETSYVQAPYRFKNILQEIRKAGYKPVLAHPERYRYMDYDDYSTLHEQGIKFQLNITSLAGAYGPEPKERAEFLIEEGLYSYQGSDLHSLTAFNRAIADRKIKKGILQQL